MITVRFLYYNWFGIIPDDYTEGNKNMIQAIVLLVFLIFLNSVFAGSLAGHAAALDAAVLNTLRQ